MHLNKTRFKHIWGLLRLGATMYNTPLQHCRPRSLWGVCPRTGSLLLHLHLGRAVVRREGQRPIIFRQLLTCSCSLQPHAGHWLDRARSGREESSFGPLPVPILCRCQTSALTWGFSKIGVALLCPPKKGTPIFGNPTSEHRNHKA